MSATRTRSTRVMASSKSTPSCRCGLSLAARWPQQRLQEGGTQRTCLDDGCIVCEIPHLMDDVLWSSSRISIPRPGNAQVTETSWFRNRFQSRGEVVWHERESLDLLMHHEDWRTNSLTCPLRFSQSEFLSQVRPEVVENFAQNSDR